MLFELDRPVTLLDAYELLSNRDHSKRNGKPRKSPRKPRRAAASRTLSDRFLTQPAEQFGGVRETIGNYLQYF